MMNLNVAMMMNTTQVVAVVVAPTINAQMTNTQFSAAMVMMMKMMEIKVWYAPYRLYCVASDDVLGNFPSQDQYP